MLNIDGLINIRVAQSQDCTTLLSVCSYAVQMVKSKQFQNQILSTYFKNLLKTLHFPNMVFCLKFRLCQKNDIPV